MEPCRVGSARNILVTGRPGIGKTTVICRLAGLLHGRRVAGFYTEEIRKEGERLGFRAVTFSGARALMAHVDMPGRQRVGRYRVDVGALERIVLPELERPCDVMLVDEIGKMECFSSAVVDAIRELLSGPVPVVATVAPSGGGFIAEVKARPDVHIHEVGHQNRDALPSLIARSLEAIPGGR